MPKSSLLIHLKSSSLPRWLYFNTTAFLMDAAMYPTIISAPIVALRFHDATNVQLGWLGALAAAGYAVVSLFAGRRSDHGHRRRWMFAGAVLQILSLLLLAFSRSRGLFIFAGILQSSLLGFFWAPFMGYMSETTSSRRLSRELGGYNLSWSAGGIFGSLIAGWSIQRFGAPGPFLFALVLVVLVLFIISTGRPCTHKNSKNEEPPPNPRVIPLKRMAWFAMTIAFFVGSMMIYLFPDRAQQAPLNFSPSGILGLQAARMFGMFLTFGIMGHLSGWHFRRAPYHMSFGLLAGALILIFLTNTWAIFFIGFLAYGSAMAVTYVLSAYYSMQIPGKTGSMLGMHEALLSTGSMIGPLFGSWIITQTGNFNAPYGYGLVPIGLAWIGCTLWMTKLPKRK